MKGVQSSVASYGTGRFDIYFEKAHFYLQDILSETYPSEGSGRVQSSGASSGIEDFMFILRNLYEISDQKLILAGFYPFSDSGRKKLPLCRE